MLPSYRSGKDHYNQNSVYYWELSYFNLADDQILLLAAVINEIFENKPLNPTKIK